MQALKLILLFTLKKTLTWVNTNTLTWELIGTVTTYYSLQYNQFEGKI